MIMNQQPDMGRHVLVADFDERFLCFQQVKQVMLLFEKDPFEVFIGRISAGEPDDIWRRTLSMLDFEEIVIFGENPNGFTT